MVGTNKNNIIQMQDVIKTYRTADVPFNALSHVTIDIRQGEFLGITGKSGAGKTTLLNMISGVSGVTSGSILFYQSWIGSTSSVIPIHAMSEDDLALWRGKNLGIIFQSFELMPSLSLLENIMLPLDFLGIYQPVISKKRAFELLELVDIVEHAHKIPAHISGGQKQRVAIARAMVNDPPLVIADEPTGNLDSITAESILEIFETLVSRGKTIVMVTHDESLAPRFSRRLQIVDGIVSNPTENGTVPVNGIETTKNMERRYSSTTISSKRYSRITLSKSTPCSEDGSSPVIRRQEEPAIILRNVSRIYENAAGKFTALKSINMQLNFGQFISIVGKSGCGKSTLLNMITGIDRPTSGEVIVGKEHIFQMSESNRASWRGRNLGVVFQFFQLLPTLTLLENIILPMDYCKVYPFSERPERAMNLLRMVGLEEQANQLPAAVSSGHQQSAAIARALATDPPIILADEPTGNLDTRSADNILSLFENLAAQGKTIVIVTHDPSITQRTNQTIILSDGEIIDQTVASALPFLSHLQMLAATRQAKKQVAAPGTTILQQGQSVEYFFMVESGEVEVVIQIDGVHEMRLACLGPGQFFGEVELTMGGHSIASVKAARHGAELALIPGSVFQELVNSSSAARDAIQEVAVNRLAENINGRNTIQ